MLRRALGIVLLSLVGCKSDTVSPPAEESIDGVWRAISYERHGDLRVVPHDQVLLFEFRAPILTARGVCNHCGDAPDNTFTTQSGGRIHIQLACTEIGCDVLVAVGGLLGGDGSYAIHGESLEIAVERFGLVDRVKFVRPGSK